MADTAMKNGMNEFLTVYTALYVELPFAGLRMGLGMSDEKEATEAAWKSYDASVKLTSTAIDDMYRNPLMGEMTATTLDTMLRWQRANTALTGAFFTGMWKALSLPTAGEIQTLREEVRALAERSQPIELQVTPKMKPAAAANGVVRPHRKVAQQHLQTTAKSSNAGDFSPASLSLRIKTGYQDAIDQEIGKPQLV